MYISFHKNKKLKNAEKGEVECFTARGKAGKEKRVVVGTTRRDTFQ
jgi:hypothetical protein